MPAAKLYKSLLTNCEVQLRKAAVGRSNGTGFVAIGAGQI